MRQQTAPMVFAPLAGTCSLPLSLGSSGALPHVSARGAKAIGAVRSCIHYYLVLASESFSSVFPYVIEVVYFANRDFEFQFSNLTDWNYQNLPLYIVFAFFVYLSINFDFALVYPSLLCSYCFHNFIFNCS